MGHPGPMCWLVGYFFVLWPQEQKGTLQLIIPSLVAFETAGFGYINFGLSVLK